MAVATTTSPPTTSPTTTLIQESFNNNITDSQQSQQPWEDFVLNPMNNDNDNEEKFNSNTTTSGNSTFFNGTEYPDDDIALGINTNYTTAAPQAAPTIVTNNGGKPIIAVNTDDMYFDPNYQSNGANQNMIIVSILIGLICVLCIILGFVTIPPLIIFIQRRLPVPQKRIDRRYATIDGWLITKVCSCRFVNSKNEREITATPKFSGFPLFLLFTANTFILSRLNLHLK